MKKSVLLVAGMMASAIVFAQESQGERNRSGNRENMKNVLMLDQAQEATIHSINKKFAEASATIRLDSTQSHEEMRKEMKSLRAKREKEINAVLTPEQNEKWKAHRVKRIAEQKERMKKAQERRDDRIKTELSLTNEQAEKLKAARKDYANNLAKLKAEHDAKVKSILTDEQVKKMNERKINRKHGRKQK